MQQIADDGYRQRAEIALVVPYGEQIEQTLGRMRVTPVAGIDHMDACPSGSREMARNQVRCSALTMADDEHVRVHRDQIVYGVEQGLSLGRRRHSDVEVDHIGGETLGRDLEGRARACA